MEHFPLDVVDQVGCETNPIHKEGIQVWQYSERVLQSQVGDEMERSEKRCILDQPTLSFLL